MGKAAPKHRADRALAPRHEPKPVDPQRYGQGRGGRPWRRKREQVMKRDKYLCRCDECTASGALKVAHEVDHIVPLSQGGTDEPGNLRAINRDCHKAKTAREIRGRR